MRVGERGSRERRRGQDQRACGDDRGDQDQRMGTAEQPMNVLDVVIVLGGLSKTRAADAEDDEAAQDTGDGASRAGRGRCAGERSQVRRQRTRTRSMVAATLGGASSSSADISVP